MKTYIKPAICISEVQLQQMVAESLPSSPDLPGIGTSRYRSKLWDDDDSDWLQEE